jgi:glucokinase
MAQVPAWNLGMDLIADIGATHSRCALLDDKGRIAKTESFENEGLSGVGGLLRIFFMHARASDKPRRAALAVAAPILGDQVSMLNRDWQFGQAELKKDLELTRLVVVNDFAAVAWGLPHLGPGHCHPIGGGTALTRAPMVAVGPGSGLGVSGIVPSGDGWAVVSGEGGHVTLPAVTGPEAEVIDSVRQEYGHCSAERLLSGPGLVHIYMTLADMAGRASAKLDPADVTGLATQGEPLARQAIGMFAALLGTIAGNLALTFGARGGVYIAGGIAPRIIDALEESEFRERFVAKGRYRDFLETVPTSVITEPVPAFRGLRALLGYR